MAFLFGAPKVSNNAPVISSLRVQTSCYGKPLPLVYGRTRVAPNLIWYNDFQSHPHSSSASAGKGGGGAQGSTEYTYSAALILALCEGQIIDVPRVWRGKEILTPATLGLDVYGGAPDQPIFPPVASKYPAEALNYPGIAYIASGAYDLGSSATLENHNAEVQSQFRISTAIPDADISQVLTDLVTDPVRGLGFSADSMGDLTAFWSFCRANGLWISPAYTEQQPVREMIKRLVEIGFSDVLYSENKLKIIPYSDVPATDNGANYEPSRVPVYELTADDFLTEGDDAPIEVERKGLGEAYNHVQVKFYDRTNDYNEQVAEAKDAADIELHGLRSMAVVEAKEICDGRVAARLADFHLRRSLNVRNTYRFRLGWKHVLLEATDIVYLTHSDSGLLQVPVMITKIEEEDETGLLSIEAEDYPMGTTKVAMFPAPVSDGYTTDFSAAPGNANVPVMFEPPFALTDSRPELWLATAGGPQWGGAQVWVSLDNASYRQVGSVTNPARYGSLSAPLAAGAAIDTAHLLSVDMSASRGVLRGGTEEDARALTTLCYVDGEYIAYADATLTGVNRYNLGYLVRGNHGSDNLDHAVGRPFVRLDGSLFRYAYPKEWLGKAVWVKLVSYNRYGAALQSLAEVPAYQTTLEGAPLPAVSGLRFEQPWIGRDAKIAWEPLDGAVDYEVQVLAGDPVNIVSTVAGLASTQYAYGAGDMASAGGPWRSLVLKVRGRSVTGKRGPWAQLLAFNPQVAALTGIEITGGFKQAFFKCQTPAEGDFAGIRVWVSDTAGTPPSDATLVYDGPGTLAPISQLADGTPLQSARQYYLRAAGYDDFGKDALNVSSELAFSIIGMITETEILPGSIKTPSLAANVVTAEKIDFDSMIGRLAQFQFVEATMLKAGSVNADALAVGSSTNMLTDPGFESDGYGWSLTHVLAPTNQGYGPPGGSAYYLAGTSNKTLLVSHGTGGSPNTVASYFTQDIAVEASHTYMASVYTGAHRCVVGVYVDFFDANGNLLVGQNVLADQLNDEVAPGGQSLAAFKRVWYRAKAPANAVRSRFTLFKRGTKAGQSDSWLFAVRPYLGEVLPNQTAVPPWDAAGATIIGPGSIKTGTLSAISADLGSVTAGSLNIANRFIVDRNGSLLIRNVVSGGNRVEQDNNGARGFDANGTLRYRWGFW